ncbi:MAG TPA: hypothetical protein VL283_04405 [Candidatus Baltobacteraceae bacterium]|nr:hypothetical protein [Candidatus Baltobacteraceae bacterium]
MQLELLLPIASATPDGDVFVAGPYLKGIRIEGYEEYGAYYSTPDGCCDDPMCGIEHVEDRHRQELIEVYGDYPGLDEILWNRFQSSLASGDPLPLEHVPTVLSSRQAVIRERGELDRRNSRGASLESRSHELHKSHLRLERRGR